MGLGDHTTLLLPCLLLESSVLIIFFFFKIQVRDYSSVEKYREHHAYILKRRERKAEKELAIP